MNGASPSPNDAPVPTLETVRLRLRAHHASDHAALAAIWSDPTVMRYIGGVQSSAPVVWQRLLMYRGLWAVLGYGYWAIEDKADGRMIGDIGFADFHRDVPDAPDAPEAGWVLAADHHGRGLAREALTAVLAWGDHHLGASRTWCLIAPDNAASIRLAEYAGFVKHGERDYRGAPVCLFERARCAPGVE